MKNYICNNTKFINKLLYNTYETNFVIDDFVEEYLGDLTSLEYLTKAVVEGSSASSKVLLNIAFNDHKNDIPKGDMTPPPQCMPDQYKLRSDLYVNAYRNFYKGEKEYFAKWEKGRNQPEWWSQ